MENGENSVIQDFYNRQSILLTGATGFLGKAITEKLLRTCPNLKKLFLLIRMKKGKDCQQRIKELFNEPLFDRMKKDNPEYMDKVVVIPGDVSCPDLDISDVDKEKLINEVTVVFHGAATVRFNEKLKMAVAVNIIGTKEMLALCSKMKKLKAFLHISTAYANCNREEVEEIVYKPPVTADLMICLFRDLQKDSIDHPLPISIQDWPNTYAFTKQISEDLVRSEATSKGIPTAILRPGIVISSYEEPFPGWIDNLYGPVGMLAAVNTGIVRTTLCDKDVQAELVPVDMTVNAALVVAWEIAHSKSNGCNNSDVIQVYNYVSSPENPITWGHYLNYNNCHVNKYPTINAFWYITLIVTKYRLVFYFLSFFLHLLPALVIDSVLLILTNKPRVLQIYKKLHKLVLVLSYFCTKEWNFHQENLKKLWTKLPDSDKKMFNFNMENINWDSYFANYLNGMNVYLFKEPPETLPASRKKYFRLYILHRVVQAIFFLTICWISYTPTVILLNWIVEKSN